MDDVTTDLGTYLRARRDRLRPQEHGFDVGRGRRVRGLRRQEVAQLAGISADYYLRLEQGKDRHPSAQVLAALARTFGLDADGREHLFRLAGQVTPRQATGTGDAAATGPDAVDVTAVLSSWSTVPAFVTDRHHDLVAADDLACMLLPQWCGPGTNLLEAVVTRVERDLDERNRAARERTVADMTAALRFHAEAGDPRLAELVRTLAPRSTTFRRVWTEHEARPLREGSSPVEVAPFGTVTFRWQTLAFPGGEHFLSVFSGSPGSAAAATVDFLRA
ncbi:helix-turn-helix domain-containing protein [Curtobacterium caseinilyticum]|uniref:Helix-turn-helix transcriptional regulator n=1 Tax=Curtobacterium caseinilyticum TaxID=3055137 RepID=A0ABT7TT82_9MICO|nr:helix-turn-helix transcriptional regulator [Curtobacterium caseinilyticum]MDM7892825.1 helix-turn-helix transcriptional regulator [Curtobacterium caseinilyticum]